MPAWGSPARVFGIDELLDCWKDGIIHGKGRNQLWWPPLRRAMRLQYLVALVDIKPSIIRGCRKSFLVYIVSMSQKTMQCRLRLGECRVFLWIDS